MKTPRMNEFPILTVQVDCGDDEALEVLAWTPPGLYYDVEKEEAF